MARAIQLTSVTIAERTHASRCLTPRSKPSFASAHSALAFDLVQVLDQVQRAQPAAAFDRAAQLRHQHLFVVLVLDLALRRGTPRVPGGMSFSRSTPMAGDPPTAAGDPASPSPGERWAMWTSIAASTASRSPVASRSSNRPRVTAMPRRATARGSVKPWAARICRRRLDPRVDDPVEQFGRARAGPGAPGRRARRTAARWATATRRRCAATTGAWRRRRASRGPGRRRRAPRAGAPRPRARPRRAALRSRRSGGSASGGSCRSPPRARAG